MQGRRQARRHPDLRLPQRRRDLDSRSRRRTNAGLRRRRWLHPRLRLRPSGHDPRRRRFEPQRPGAMPRTADAIVAELHGVLEASRTAPPYVLAAHSLGGLFARLYAATYPGDVAGLALVDAWQEDLPSILGPAQWSAYVDLATPPPPGLEAYRDLESVDFAAASARMREAARTPPADAVRRHLAGKAGPTSAERLSCFIGGRLRSRVAGGPGPACGAPPRCATRNRDGKRPLCPGRAAGSCGRGDPYSGRGRVQSGRLAQMSGASAPFGNRSIWTPSPRAGHVP